MLRRMAEPIQDSKPKASFTISPAVDELYAKEYRWYENVFFTAWGLVALLGLPICLILLVASLF
ncbi:hypothetical protein FHS47_001737 [Lutibacter sp. SG786]|nr:hypothetical protein [Luteibacter sp. SG786]